MNKLPFQIIRCSKNIRIATFYNRMLKMLLKVITHFNNLWLILKVLISKTQWYSRLTKPHSYKAFIKRASNAKILKTTYLNKGRMLTFLTSYNNPLTKLQTQNLLKHLFHHLTNKKINLSTINKISHTISENS